MPLGTVELTGDVHALLEGRPVRFKVRASDLPALRERLSAAHPEAEVDGDAIAIGRGRLPEAILERHRQPSFLIDFDQQAVGEVAGGLPAPVTPAGLRAGVAAHFERVQYGGFWPASRAAKRRVGDCSEYAVLTAALARASATPARVVFGYVVQIIRSRVFAIGHAWAEVHDGVDWRRIDATPFGETNPIYVILGELEDEGPGFALTMFGLTTVLLSTTLEVVDSADSGMDTGK